MRIAAVNWNRALVGGAETYLDAVLPALAAAGQQIAFFSELGSSPSAQRIRLPECAPAWCTSEMGLPQALAALESWRPDTIYVHAMDDLPTAARIVEIGAAQLLAPAYSG